MNLQEAIEEASRQLGFCLKEKQYEAVSTFCLGKDVFVSLPTGYGKSIVYAILPLVFDKLRGKKGSFVICITPLTAIMVEQKAKFVAAGLIADFVGEAQTDSTTWKRVVEGKIQLIYVSPENIIHNSYYRQVLLSPVYKENLVCVAVDEAHCVKSWGDEFRTSYASLGELRSLVSNNVHFMALTATATHETLEVVKQRLALQEPVVIGLSPNRPNIFLSVVSSMPLDIFANSISEDLKNKRTDYAKTVVFCHSYQDCSNLYAAIVKLLGNEKTKPPGYPNLLQYRLVTMYTRASTNAMKELIMSLFSQKETTLRVLIATTAFSMGVDIPDIHQIIHWGAPYDVDQYLQEIGRAGRDGRSTRAVLLCGEANKRCSMPMRRYIENKHQCRRMTLFGLFIMYEHSNDCLKCACCDICANSCDCNDCNN